MHKIIRYFAASKHKTEKQRKNGITRSKLLYWHMGSNKSSARLQFQEYLDNWNQETGYLSQGNFNNRYFDEIVKMKEEAVPFIYEELKKGPTLLVHALDLIYPDTIKCEGYIPLTTICETWKNLLNKRFAH